MELFFGDMIKVKKALKLIRTTRRVILRKTRALNKIGPAWRIIKKESFLGYNNQ